MKTKFLRVLPDNLTRSTDFLLVLCFIGRHCHLRFVIIEHKNMAKLVLSSFIANGTLSIYLDNNLIVENNQSVTLDIIEGEEYIVHWLVKGAAGSPYSITISSPKESQFQLTKNLRKAGKDIGFVQFLCT